MFVYLTVVCLEPRVSLDAASLSSGIEVRLGSIPPSPNLFGGFTGYGCCNFQILISWIKSKPKNENPINSVCFGLNYMKIPLTRFTDYVSIQDTSVNFGTILGRH